jgi:hypothetical protein
VGEHIPDPSRSSESDPIDICIREEVTRVSVSIYLRPDSDRE